jgi:hypothetical protein
MVGALLLLSGSAFASVLKGTVQGVTPETHQVQLDDGTVYQAKPTVDLSTIHKGDNVTLTMTTQNTKPVITKIEKN